MNNKVRAIAFYLPQFYPTPENDEWWEPGFTEWTNVAKAKPLFRGHIQPRIPRDLSFYDLRVPEVREQQAQLAREAGIEGFCYWHYWFGNGRRLLSDVFKEVVNSGEPHFPFCLCWANHSWYAKTWNPDVPDKLLLEQKYPGVSDFEAHFYEMLPAFKDKRYIKVDDKLLFGIYEPGFEEVSSFMDAWNRLAIKNGLNGFHFFALAKGKGRFKKEYIEKFDSIVYDCLLDAALKYNDNYLYSKIVSMGIRFFNHPHITKYTDYVNYTIDFFKRNPSFIPCINPDFDHSPRIGARGVVLHGSSPEKWGRFVHEIKKILEDREHTSSLLFIKAWNEWAEGNYLEPDRRFGKGYLTELKKALE